MWKSNVKNIFHISRWPVKVSTGQTTWCFEEFPDCAIIHYMPAHSRQSEQQNIIDRTHTWQQCSVTISKDILTTKYGFNLRRPFSDRFHRLASITSVTHALIGPHDHPSWHIFEETHAGSIPYSSVTLRCIIWRAGETVLNATVPTSQPGDHSLAESRWRFASCLLC